MEQVYIEYKNSAYIRVFADDSTERNISDYFTFEVPNARFTPAYKKRIWDGKIRLYNIHTKCIYAGLYEYLLEYCDQRNLSVKVDSRIPFNENKFSEKDIINYFEKELKPHSRGKQLQAHEHQVLGVMKALNLRRCLLLSPTASGKSLIIYSLLRYYQNIIGKKEKILIIVPTISLVLQLYNDFADYSDKDKSWDVSKNCHKIHGGEEKETSKQIVISTWQSIYKMSEKYFKDFRVVIGDECLHPDSMISLPGGKERKISDLKVGDLVNTYNEKTGEIEEKPIVKIHENISIVEDMYELHLENGRSVKITGNHKVLLSSGCWKRVDELKEGDIINSIE